MRAKKTDANHTDIAGYFERAGCLVHHTIGDWDLTISKFGLVRLIEVKDPESPNLKRKNKGDDLKAKGWPIIKVMCLDDVLSVAEGLNAEARHSTMAKAG